MCKKKYQREELCLRINTLKLSKRGEQGDEIRTCPIEKNGRIITNAGNEFEVDIRSFSSEMNQHYAD